MGKRQRKRARLQRARAPQIAPLDYLTNYRQLNTLLGRSRVQATVERIEPV
jgi:hypothetical protein